VGEDVQGVCREGEASPTSSEVSGTTTVHPQPPRGSSASEQHEEEEEEPGELPHLREQEGLPLSTIEMEIDNPSLFLHASTLPTTPHTTPGLSAKDPIRDALEVVYQAATAGVGPSSSSSSSATYTNHPGEGWYKYSLGSAHVSIDIPTPLLTTQRNSDNTPAKYLKAVLLAGTPTLLGC
jgi:hypothetical protein